MDPFLELHWSDVHAALIGYVRDALSPQLPDSLVGRIEANILLEDLDSGQRYSARPDVFVATSPARFSTGQQTGSAVLDEPVFIQRLETTRIERSIHITDLQGNRLITVIEILSPWNKTPASARRAYLKKRDKYLAGDVHFVEIDLVRAGDWSRMVSGSILLDDLRTTYRISVFPAGNDGMYLYPIPLTSRLPTIAVPLRPQDKPAVLALQGLLDQAYERGRYSGLDYSKPCSPPLTNAEAEVVRPLLKDAGKIK